MSEQAMSIIRWMLTIVGGYLAQRGLISNADLSSLTTAFLGAIGPLTMLGTAVWGWYSHSHAAAIATVNNSVPGVKVVASNSPGAVVTTPPKV